MLELTIVLVVAGNVFGALVPKLGSWAHLLYKLVAFAGFPIHELGHWLPCKVFGIRVLHAKFFPDLDGDLLESHVVHGPPPHLLAASWVFLGPVILSVLLSTAIMEVLAASWAMMDSFTPFVLCFWVFSMCSSCIPSPVDVRNFLKQVARWPGQFLASLGGFAVSVAVYALFPFPVDTTWQLVAFLALFLVPGGACGYVYHRLR